MVGSTCDYNYDINSGYSDGSGGADRFLIRIDCRGSGAGEGSGYSYGYENGHGYGNHIEFSNEDCTGHGGGSANGDQPGFTHFLMSRLHD